MLAVRLGMARQHQMAPVGGRHMDVDHLQSGELLDDGTWGEAGRVWPGEVLQGHEQAVGDERDEDVCLDPFLDLVEDGSDGKMVLELLERLLDFGELHVVAPQFGGVFTGHAGTDCVARYAQSRTAEPIASWERSPCGAAATTTATSTALANAVQQGRVRNRMSRSPCRDGDRRSERKP